MAKQDEQKMYLHQIAEFFNTTLMTSYQYYTFQIQAPVL